MVDDLLGVRNSGAYLLSAISCEASFLAVVKKVSYKITNRRHALEGAIRIKFND